MKRLLMTTLLLSSIILTTGCNVKNIEEADKEDKSVSSTVFNEKQTSDLDGRVRKFPIEDKGKGKLEIVTGSGEEQSGIPIVYLDKEESPTVLRVKISAIDQQKTSYFYIDGELIEEMKISDGAQTIELTDLKEALNLGNHLIQFLQYKNNDEKSEIITFKQAEYKVDSIKAENHDF